MKTYISKFTQIPSTSHAEVMQAARSEYRRIQRLTPRRRPYIRSAYFDRDKVFIDPFWQHLGQKRLGDQVRRARLFKCAVDLISHSQLAPDTIYDGGELHRFYGQTKDGFGFRVQIKQISKTGRKDFMSVFPNQ
jgi:hypothetical protein